MITNDKLYAVLVTTNRYGKNVICELSEPPENWRLFEYMQLRVSDSVTGDSHVNEIVHWERAGEIWFETTGVSLKECIQPFKERS